MKKTIRDVDVTNKRVLIRVDFNVPMSEIRPSSAVTDHNIVDDARIHATIPTIQYLIEHGAKCLILTHLGRPSGYVIENLRTDPVATRLADLMRVPVTKVNNCIGPEVQEAVKRMEAGEVLFLENVRFHPGEMVNDARFAARLAENADLFVNDAFGSAHRVHASTLGITRYLPSVAGLLMEAEIQGLTSVRARIKTPLVALLGGFRLVDKAHFIDDQLERGNRVLLGGALANTFLRASGYETGTSDVEVELLTLARGLLAQYGDLIALPQDVVITDTSASQSKPRTLPANRVPPSGCIVDIGPATVAHFSRILEQAGTIVWNGPMGAVEDEPFRHGTHALAQRIANLAHVIKIVGGGDTLAVVDMLGLDTKFDYISTGGASFLETLERGSLPAIAALQDRQPQASVQPKTPNEPVV